MRVLISGSTGLVGTALIEFLLLQGDRPVRLARPSSKGHSSGPASSSPVETVTWDPVAGTLDPAADGADAVVHLAGTSIADGRWTAARKRLLRESRVDATEQLVRSLAQLRQPPKIFVAASAVGFYGNRGDEPLTESSVPGNDFLARLAVDWEAASAGAAVFGARVVMLRFGVILAEHGGALPRMVLPFRLGVGGRIGSGRQWMSWVTLEDVVGVIGFALRNDAITGPVNTVAPDPVRNADLAATIGLVLNRPALFTTPGFVLRVVLGEMADALLLSSQRVLPEKLQLHGYPFAHQRLEPALRSVL